MYRRLHLVSKELRRKTEVSVGATDASRVISDGERSLVGVKLHQMFIRCVMGACSGGQVDCAARQNLNVPTTTAVSNSNGILRKRKIHGKWCQSGNLCQRLLLVEYFELKITDNQSDDFLRMLSKNDLPFS